MRGMLNFTQFLPQQDILISIDTNGGGVVCCIDGPPVIVIIVLPPFLFIRNF